MAKVGWLRVSLSPNPFITGAPFRQHLRLADGVCEITAGAWVICDIGPGIGADGPENAFVARSPAGRDSHGLFIGQAATPLIPTEELELDGQSVQRIRVAQEFRDDRRNVENPELYPIWPFRIYGVGRPDLEIARNALMLRTRHNDVGWGYDGSAAALVGVILSGCSGRP